MFYIEDDAIYLTRGDDAVLTVEEILAGDGTAYELRPGDVLTLTVRAIPSADSEALVKIDGAPGGNRIPIRHEDTASAAPGRYSADVQLTTAEGLRLTVWPKLEGRAAYRAKNFNNFIIMPEVTIP